MQGSQKDGVRRVRGKKLTLEPLRVVKVMVWSDPNASTKAIGPLMYHDDARDMDHLECTIQGHFVLANAFNQGVQTWACQGSRRGDPIDGRIIRKVEEGSAVDVGLMVGIQVGQGEFQCF